MSYGTLKIDTITFTDNGIDKSVSVSGLVQNPSFSGDITATGTISGNIVRGQTISGVTVTGTTAAFTTGTFISLTGTTTEGTTATYTTGSFTSLTGTTTTGTTATFASGVFTTQISGATITGTTAAFTTVTGGVATITSGVFALGTNSLPSISFSSDPNTGIYSPGADQVAISTAGSEAARIDSSGRLLVGTSSARTDLIGGTRGGQVQIEAASADAASAIDKSSLCLTAGNNTSSGGSAYIFFTRTRSASLGGVNTVSNNDVLGGLYFQGTDGTDAVPAALIKAEVDGIPGANDMPGRLVFSTTADEASSPTERMRIDSSGFISIAGDTDTGFSRPSADTLVLNAGGVGSFKIESGYNFVASHSNNNQSVGFISHTSTSFGNAVLKINCSRAANSAYSFIQAYSGSYADTEFLLRGDGTGLCDGTWTGGGADYAEYFEWSDGNPDADDRRGISVVLDGDKIREAQAGEDPIGVISGNPSVVGDAAWNKWSGKYLRDEFGTYIQEDYEVTDEDGNTVIQQRRKLNPAYDPDVEYVSREERLEWDCVGLMGKLRIRKGQVTGSRWIKMRDISDSVEEWLVR